MRWIAVLALLLVTGCGTMLAGTMEDVTIKSTPPGIKIMVDGKEHETPVTLQLARKTEHLVMFPGGQQVLVRQTFLGSGEHYLNILWGLAGIVPGVVAGIVDMVTGAKHNLEPDIMEYKEGRVYDLENGKVVPWEKTD